MLEPAAWAALLDVIRRFEGCRLEAYLCPAGVWTIGWGHTGPEVRQGLRWAQERADAQLEADALAFVRTAASASPGLLARPFAHAAVADFCFNLGAGRYRASTLRRRVNDGDWAGARTELGKWVWGGGRRLPGLVLRRQVESQLLGVEP